MASTRTSEKARPREESVTALTAVAVVRELAGHAPACVHVASAARPSHDIVPARGAARGCRGDDERMEGRRRKRGERRRERGEGRGEKGEGREERGERRGQGARDKEGFGVSKRVVCQVVCSCCLTCGASMPRLRGLRALTLRSLLSRTPPPSSAPSRSQEPSRCLGLSRSV
eukprot:3902549-Rhodomonas_salina.2